MYIVYIYTYTCMYIVHTPLISTSTLYNLKHIIIINKGMQTVRMWFGPNHTILYNEKNIVINNFCILNIHCWVVSFLCCMKPNCRGIPVIVSPWVQTKGYSHSQKNVHNFSLEGPETFLRTPFHIIILPILFCVHVYQISIHCFIIELQYNHILTLWY